jgi:O-antigen/teichoic acid export membrane protein
MESLLRLALVAATGASVGGLQRTGRRLVICAAVALGVAIIAAAAVGCFAAAGWYALLPQVGPAGAALIIGLALAVIAAVVWAIAERRHRKLPPPSSGLLEALPFAASQIPSGDDVANMLSRHAGTIMIAAFAVGMFLNRKR